MDVTDIVCEGWLVKSPPAKLFARARWRLRFFILRRCGSLPCQYVLEYFTDASRRKLKGRIELDQCEEVEVDVSVDAKKCHSGHMFDIRTPKRTFYLVAETRALMDLWTRCICQVCGLKTTQYVTNAGDGAEPVGAAPAADASNDEEDDSDMSLPRSPCAISGPYIPISECITGAPLAAGGALSAARAAGGATGGAGGSVRAPVSINPFGARRLSTASTVVAPVVSGPREGASVSQPPPLSPHSVVAQVPDTAGQSTGDHTRSTSLPDTVSHLPTPSVASPAAAPADGECPPRPPKPAHLSEAGGHQRVASFHSPLLLPSSSLDSDYLTPRTPNTVPADELPRCSSGARPATATVSATTPQQQQPRGQIFNYDFSDRSLQQQQQQLPPPLQQQQSTQCAPHLPPVVNRFLKPRKVSETGDVSLAPSSRSPDPCLPVVDRALKPSSRPSPGPPFSASDKVFNLAPPPASRHHSVAVARRQRAAPSPSPSVCAVADSRCVVAADGDCAACLTVDSVGTMDYHHQDGEAIQYLDLDINGQTCLEVGVSAGPAAVVPTMAGSVAGAVCAEAAPAGGVRSVSGVVYKTVDFVKTEAFNKTRQSVRQQRGQA